MNKKLVGKPSPSRLHALLKGHFGKKSADILIGPGPGLDAAILDLKDGRVMAVAEDPIFPAPGLPLDIMGRFTAHIGASDVAVTGVKPEYMTYTLLLPGSSPEKDAKTLIRSISDAAESLGIAILGGHTGWYEAVNIPIVGGVTVWGFAQKDRWVSPGGAKDGDVILMSKGPAVEAAALLSVLYRERLEARLSPKIIARLLARIDQISVVEDALLAFRTGGVHAMHDATEGGVLGGLWEMHAASGLNLTAELNEMTVPEDIRDLAQVLQFDPWKAISEGTLLAAVEPKRAADIQEAWNSVGIHSMILGRFDAGLSSSLLIRDGKETPLLEPDVDPFWELFFEGLK
jgi:hydrogenase maturation factor